MCSQFRVDLFPVEVLGIQGYIRTHESLGALPSHLAFSGLTELFNHFLSRYPNYGSGFFESGAMGSVTTDNPAPISTMKSIRRSPYF